MFHLSLYVNLLQSHLPATSPIKPIWPQSFLQAEISHSIPSCLRFSSAAWGDPTQLMGPGISWYLDTWIAIIHLEWNQIVYIYNYIYKSWKEQKIDCMLVSYVFHQFLNLSLAQFFWCWLATTYLVSPHWEGKSTSQCKPPKKNLGALQSQQINLV